MAFKIEFATRNAAFVDDDNTGNEVRRILDGISEAIAFGRTEGRVMDTNGNTVGSWELTTD